MGFGKSQGCVAATFDDERRVRTASLKIQPGNGWRRVYKREHGVWLLQFLADKWKAWEHDRWMTAPGSAGGLTLHGTAAEYGERMSVDSRSHHAYAHHIVNEKEVEEMVKGVFKRYWHCTGHNHWLDASAMSDCAADMNGVNLLRAKARKTKDQGQRKSLAEMSR